MNPGRTLTEAFASRLSFGLAATVWTTRLDSALSLAERLEAGIIWTNCPHYLSWHVPYEGHGVSGLGEDLGIEVAGEFTKLKVNYIQYNGASIN